MRYVDLVVIMLKAHLELERIIISASLLFHRILVIGYVVTVTVPTDTVGSARFSLRIKERPLALVITRVWFHKVDNCEFVLDVPSDVRDSKVEPLGVCRCVMVVLEYQIVAVGLV
jgi:hypothetical protein